MGVRWRCATHGHGLYVDVDMRTTTPDPRSVKIVKVCTAASVTRCRLPPAGRRVALETSVDGVVIGPLGIGGVHVLVMYMATSTTPRQRTSVF